jgi:hypothetical protein
MRWPEQLELLLETVYEHLRRILVLYAALMAYRKGQLEHRHEAALANDAAHSKQYFRYKVNYHCRQRFGRWPWEKW